jgi:dipeptidyl aminopeptidase/acylaminoacyl peptidase
MNETPITFSNHGQQLVGMLHLPDGPGPHPAVIFYHGFTGNRIENHFIFVKMARMLAKAGFVAMRFDFRGSGESQGEFVEMTLPGEVDDARVALAWLRARPEVDADNVSILGLSMGGAVAATIAGKNPDIRKLMLWSALADPLELFRASANSEPLPPPLGLQPDGTIDVGGHLIGPGFIATLGQVRPLESVNAFRRPALIIHGTADPTVPPAHAERFLRAIGEEYAELHWIEGADHTYSAHVWEQEAMGRTLKWLME